MLANKSLDVEELRWSPVAVLAVIAISAILEVAKPVLTGHSLLALLMAVLLGAWHGGFVAGLTGTVTALLVATYLFIPPLHSFRVASHRDLIFLLLAGAEGLLISWLCEQRRRLNLAYRDIAAEVKLLRTQPERSRAVVAGLESDFQELKLALPVWLGSSLRILKDGREKLAIHCPSWSGAEEIVSRMSRAEERILAFGNSLQSFTQTYPRQWREPVLSRAVIGEVIAFLQSGVSGSAARIVLPERLPAVCVRRSDLFRIFHDLLSDAIRRGAIEPPLIRISGREEDGQFLFAISDNGAGLIPIRAAQAFSWFGRSEAEDPERMGVGLAVTRRIVRSYGGDIALKSCPGSGTTVSFTVPLVSSSTTTE